MLNFVIKVTKIKQCKKKNFEKNYAFIKHSSKRKKATSLDHQCKNQSEEKIP